MSGLPVDAGEGLEDDLMEPRLVPQLVGEGLSAVLPGLPAAKIPQVEEDGLSGGRSWGEGVGPDPGTQRGELFGGDPPEVDEDAGLDMVPFPIALGEARVETAVGGGSRLR
jgi:hypothetical protein